MAEETSAIPYVIDNQQHKLVSVLRRLLERHRGLSLDVATAYFSAHGFGLVREHLGDLGSFRLLLGEAPKEGRQVGLRLKETAIDGLIEDIGRLPFEEKTLRLIEDLIGFLRRDSVAVRHYTKGFLHAKAWLFFRDRPSDYLLFERFQPMLAIVGSSNFTQAGLASNRELNLVHKVFIDDAEIDDRDAREAVAWLSEHSAPESRDSAATRRVTKSEVGARAILELEAWYRRQWADADDFKEQLIDLLDASKFGEKEYSPYQVYLKAIYEYFRADLDSEERDAAQRSAVELTEFQDDAVKKARRILQRYHGVMVADSVGLGKTWIGKKLLEDFAYHQRMKAIVVCPASLRANWEKELGSATIAAKVLSHEELGRPSFDPRDWADVDVVLIDESHNFRNPNAQRYASLERLLAGNGRRGRSGERKRVILLTATPINNDLLDLYHQLALITLGDKSHFLACGIGDLHRYFLRARKVLRSGGPFQLFNLLEEVVVRRTRAFVRRAYPEAMLDGRPIHFPERRLRTVRYNLEATYEGIYETVVSNIAALKLVPYHLENYKKKGVSRDAFEEGREQALVGIFKSRFLKRFESSVESFRISLRRALELFETFRDYFLEKKLLRSKDFHKALRFLSDAVDEDGSFPGSRADEMDSSLDARAVVEAMEPVDPALYDLRGLRRDISADVERLRSLYELVRGIAPDEDAKLHRLRDLLRGELKGRKVLIFTYYKDTARYLYEQLGHPDSEAARVFRAELEGVKIRRMDSDSDPKERLRLIQGFAPKANGKGAWQGTEKEVDILISTDVLSEGHNLQDCGLLINYDLHWNPTRMVQRAGRIDRLGSDHQELLIYNMFPDAGLERLLRLVQSLSAKISAIDSTGFLDTQILSDDDVANPRNFNTLKRIAEEDLTVLQEEEERSELPSSESLEEELRLYLAANGREGLETLPDGIHSGLVKKGARGVFFAFKVDEEIAGPRHFWRYLDLVDDDRIVEDRQWIAERIACEPQTPRIVDSLLKERVFALQETAIEDILRSVDEQASLEVAPRSVDPVQTKLAQKFQDWLGNPELPYGRLVEAGYFINEPMVVSDLRELRKAVKEHAKSGNALGLLEKVETIAKRVGSAPRDEPQPERKPLLERGQLKLVCFDFLSGA